ncbi:MAG: hypothetical protein L7S72_08365 [Flavobacteriales bacterium]|nr:hypothetical protein [Flavobacteriales bacterium]
MAENTDNSRNEVEIDLEKYMAMIEKLDEQEDLIKEMKDEAREAAERLGPRKRKFMDLFIDNNDLNEKAIIGFISFFLMVVFGITDLVTALVWDMDLKVSETIYTSFVVVTLGAFGISEAGKAFGK